MEDSQQRILLVRANSSRCSFTKHSPTDSLPPPPPSSSQGREVIEFPLIGRVWNREKKKREREKLRATVRASISHQTPQRRLNPSLCPSPFTDLSPVLLPDSPRPSIPLLHPHHSIPRINYFISSRSVAFLFVSAVHLGSRPGGEA